MVVFMKNMGEPLGVKTTTPIADPGGMVVMP